MEDFYNDLNEMLGNINISLKITSINQIEYIIDLIKSDDKLGGEFNIILRDVFENFISIKYILNNKIYYYSSYNIINSYNPKITLSKLYETIKLDLYNNNYDIQENMVNDDTIYNEIMNYIETNNFLITGLGDKEYYTDNYKIFKEKYLKFEIKDIFKSNKEIDEIIKLCNIIKNKYYFSPEIKVLFSKLYFSHYEKFKSKKAQIIKNIILF